jgi:hypothetical protein
VPPYSLNHHLAKAFGDGGRELHASDDPVPVD